MVILTERMRTLRIEKGFKQREMAEQLGISVRTYQYYESGGHRPDYEMLFALADVFDVSIDYLLGRSDLR